jgi:hypothetical protein
MNTAYLYVSDVEMVALTIEPGIVTSSCPFHISTYKSRNMMLNQARATLGMTACLIGAMNNSDAIRMNRTIFFNRMKINP